MRETARPGVTSTESEPNHYRSRRTIMASPTNTRTTSSAIAALILAAAIGCTPIIAAVLTSAPSAEVAR